MFVFISVGNFLGGGGVLWCSVFSGLCLEPDIWGRNLMLVWRRHGRSRGESRNTRDMQIPLEGDKPRESEIKRLFPGGDCRGETNTLKEEEWSCSVG